MVLLGAPGAGKGTQAQLLGDYFRVPHVSSGDILREAVRRSTPLGEKARLFMERGELVPDDILLDVMRERLAQSDCAGGFVLDGFPRTVPQAEALEKILADLDAPIDAVVSVDVPEETLVARMSGRRTCSGCGALYHVEFNPPQASGKCDQCGADLFQRDDDVEETIRARLRIYRRDTAPLLEWYGASGRLEEIDGIGERKDVLARIVAAGEAEVR